MTVEGTTDYDEDRSYQACLGPAQIVVRTGENGGVGFPRKVMRTLPFRVLPPWS